MSDAPDSDARLPASWTVRSLASISTKPQYGWTTSASPNGEVRLVRTTDITRGPISWSEVPYCTEVPGDLSKYKLVSGDILVSRAGSVGFSALLEQAPPLDAVFASYLIRLRPSSEALPRFLALFMQSPGYWAQITDMSAGVALLNINASKLSALRVPLPPLEEQHRIVALLEEHLSRLDAVLATVTAIREKASQFHRSLLHQAFSGELAGAGDDWRMRTLNDLVEDRSDIVDGPFGSNLKSAHYVDQGARVIRLQNIGFGDYVPGDAFITLEHYKSLAKHNVTEGDLLFASLGENLPRACLAPKFDEPAIVKADCARVRLRTDINRKFVLHATQRPEARRWAANALHGMGRPRLGLGSIREFPVPVPTRSVQDAVVEAIEEHLSLVDGVLAGVDAAERKCDAARRSLLHAAFTGRLTEEWRETTRV